MTIKTWQTLLARIIAVGYFGLTCVYCLLYFMPFTYVQLLESELVPALVFFEHAHAWLFLPVAWLMDVSVRHANARSTTRLLQRGFRVAMVAGGALLLIRPVLPHLENNLSAFIWSQVALVPLLWVAGIDLVATRGRGRWSKTPAGESRLLISAGMAAMFSWVISTAVAIARPGIATSLTAAELGVAAAWSFSAHLILFLGVCTCLLLLRGIAALSRQPARVEALLLAFLSIVFLAGVIHGTVFAGLAFTGGFADVAAATLAGALVVSLVGLNARHRLDEDEPLSDGFALVFGAVTPVGERSTSFAWVWLSLVGVSAWLLMTSLAPIDWNFLLQRLCMVAVWVAAFAAFHAMIRGHAHTLQGLVVSAIIPLGALGIFRGASAPPAVEGVVERYTGYDVSAGLLRSWLQPRAANTESDVELFKYLQAYTGIPQSVNLTPRDVRFVADASATATARPHIFIVVVDSLRRDYLGSYNPDVTFTPSIDAFASDGLVFEQAFSRYGATGLSEPSIWVGGLLPHKQYVSPFAPMNSLQTLLRSQGYEAFISVDPILDKILETEGWVTELDKGRKAGEIELCRSLDELQERLSARTDQDGPFFAYTQPQNIHIATINRGGVEAVDDTDYEAFYAPYASRLRQIDTCFGRFVEHLKKEDLYGDSVIILTSDHGDSLGEEGRFGHAYTIFPEIVRVPLIMRVPDGLVDGLGVDTGGLAFTTDLSPTLHTLLGFKPDEIGPMFGRSLFTHRADERRDYVMSDHLMASSYGPVYGIISEGGRSFYILDSVNYRDYLYDLTMDSNTESLRLDEATRRRSRAKIRALVEQLNGWYGVGEL